MFFFDMSNLRWRLLFQLRSNRMGTVLLSVLIFITFTTAGVADSELEVVPSPQSLHPSPPVIVGEADLAPTRELEDGESTTSIEDMTR